MKQRTNLKLLVAILGFFALGAVTQTASAQQAKEARIVVVDLQEIYRTSLAGKDLLKQIETRRAELEAEAARYQQDARDEQTELERQQAILSAEAFEEKRRSIGQKYTSIQTDLRDKARRLQIAQSKADRELQSSLVPIYQEMLRAHSANLIMDRGQIVLPGPGLDITREVIEKLDAAMPTIKLQAGDSN